MSMEEASERYGIPIQILKEYQALGLCNSVKVVMSGGQVNDTDLKRLSLIMTLYDCDFTEEKKFWSICSC